MYSGFSTLCLTLNLHSQCKIKNSWHLPKPLPSSWTENPFPYKGDAICPNLNPCEFHSSKMAGFMLPAAPTALLSLDLSSLLKSTCILLRTSHACNDRVKTTYPRVLNWRWYSCPCRGKPNFGVWCIFRLTSSQTQQPFMDIPASPAPRSVDAAFFACLLPRFPCLPPDWP